MIKEQTAFEEGQATRYTFFMVEVSMKNCPGVTILKVFFRNDIFSYQKSMQRPKCQYQGKTWSLGSQNANIYSFNLGPKLSL